MLYSKETTVKVFDKLIDNSILLNIKNDKNNIVNLHKFGIYDCNTLNTKLVTFFSNYFFHLYKQSNQRMTFSLATAIQFFIIDSNDYFNEKSHSLLPFSIALERLLTNYYEEKKYYDLNDLFFSSNNVYEKKDIVSFFSNIVVLSDYSSIDFFPIKDNNTLLKEDKTEKFTISGILNSAKNISFDTNFIKELIPKKESIDDFSFLNGLTPNDYCKSILKNVALTQLQKYEKILHFYKIIVKSKLSKDVSSDFDKILSFHFNQTFDKTIEIKFDTEKLFEEHLPKAIDILFIKKDIEIFELLNQFSVKIISYYNNLIDLDSNIFKKFLISKTGVING